MILQSESRCATSDPRIMDLRLQASPQLHYGVNGDAGRNSRTRDDDTLKFLSQEEQECIQFFEKTIDSLDESLEENDRMKPPANSIHQTSSPSVSSRMSRHPVAKDQDIIYLVSPEPDLLQNKEPIYNPTSPDFMNMMQTPGSHFEIKPKRDVTDSLPSEYNPPLPSGSYGATDGHFSYHPPGCIPTPVLIAQQIADNQAGTSSNLHPSSFLRRPSIESDKQWSPSSDLPKHGPPTYAKPNRFPANISVIHGHKDTQNQSMANVHIHERKAQMLANLTGTAHPLLQDDSPLTVESRNTPTRSISFKDPSPDKSRMEALSKLGLNRNRAMSGGTSLLPVPDASLGPLAGAEAKSVEVSAPPTPRETTTKLPGVRTPSQSQIVKKPEIERSESLKRFDERSRQSSPSPPAMTRSSYHPPPPLLETRTSPSFPPPPEVTSLEPNNYGGKSITVNPSHSFRRESLPSPSSPDPKVLPPALANPTEFNTYGGKTKVMTPSHVARSDLPDILSSHIDKSQSLPAKQEPLPTALNSYGGKSRTFNPSYGLNRPTDSPSKSFKAPSPAPAPRPPRHSYHGGVSTPLPAPRALSPDHRRRSTFRPQGITVQFSGRGATDESRREALRKLGLWKES
ncbi:proline and serine-rich protein 2 [Trematomus bernacchii]|uniref:proline and serine-rich protein 2 n=1 Tax=Trematomus bernacchii TaxID=40690 RepID=UPI00146F49DA|nr:proline and serine-rich protein 2 [Trematomus bernacchii]